MKHLIHTLAAAALLASACQPAPAPTTVHLQGQLVDMGTTDVPMRYDGAAFLVGDSRDIILHTDAEGRFDTVLTLTAPTYYSISRNTLYLTPGDDLTLRITQDNRQAEFTGQGASVNTYMKGRLFPKGGSFLEGGSNLRPDFAGTKALVDSLAAVRRAQLDTLTGATDAFKRLEGARITADVANSFLSYPSYAAMRGYLQMTPESLDSVYATLKPDLVPLLRTLTDDELLDVAVVRDVLGSLATPYTPALEAIAGEVTLSPRARELYAAAGQVNRLRHRVDEAQLQAARAFADSLTHTDFADELRAKLDQAARLLKGQPAIDFSFTDTEGKAHRLSDFRGKVLYLDFWATWCGPCIQESPHFEKLATRFKDADVVFIPISTDTGREAWLSYLKAHDKQLPQYNSTDEALRTGWSIHYIPRFVLIDRDFNIADAYAPRPSQPEAAEALQGLLGN